MHRMFLYIAAAGLPICLFGGAGHADLVIGSDDAVAGSFSSRADGHAPIGVMGDHLHGEGEWMAAIRHMNMRMDGTRSGTTDLTEAQVLSDFLVVPTRMDMDMIMFGGMYAPTADLTLMAMGMYQHNSMDHLVRNGLTFTTHASGFADTRVGGLYRLWRVDHAAGHHQIHANFMVGLPTGAINKTDLTPAGRTVLPYPMQLGSGTVDLLPGITYGGHAGRISWGAQARGTIRLGTNYRGYSLGNIYAFGAHIAGSLWDWISLSFRLDYMNRGNIDGRDPAFDGQVAANLVHTVRTDNKGGQQLDGLLGVNLITPNDWGYAGNHRFAAEFGMPLWENLDGPQMSTSYTIMVGWQRAF